MGRVGLTLIVAAVSTTAAAHHSTRAFYDRDSSIELEGTITSVFWRNPHVGLTLLVDDENGEQTEWTLEGGAMNTLVRRGFTESSVAVGDHVRVAGGPALRGERAIFVTNFLLPTGQEILFTDRTTPLLWTGVDRTTAASASAARPTPAADIFRVWSEGGAYRLRAPLELTEAAEAARSAWNPTVDDPALRCEAPGMPNAILNPYPIELIDEGSEIRLKIEEWDAVRLIHLSGADAPAQATPGRLGFSTGRWEGDTLVVRTTNVSWPYLDDSGTPMSDDVEMIERFTLHREEGRLDYEVTVTDPKNLVAPAVWEATRVWIPGVEVRPFQCTLK